MPAEEQEVQDEGLAAKLLKECGESKLGVDEGRVASLLERVILSLRQISKQNESGNRQKHSFLECASKLASIVAGMLQKRVQKIHEPHYQSYTSSSQIISTMEPFFQLHMNELIELKEFIPKIVESHVKNLLGLYFKTRQPLLVAHMDHIYSSPLHSHTSRTDLSNPTQNEIEDGQNTRNIQTSPGEGTRVMRLQEMLHCLISIYQDEKKTFKNVFHSANSTDEPFLHFFYQNVILRYKLLIKRRIFVVPGVEALHESIFEIICKIDDSFLKKAIFVNVFDQLQSFLIQLWNDFLHQEENQRELEDLCPVVDDTEGERAICPLDNGLGAKDDLEIPNVGSVSITESVDEVETTAEIVHKTISMNRIVKENQSTSQSSATTLAKDFDWRPVFMGGLKFFDLFLFFDNISMQKESASLLASILFAKQLLHSQVAEETDSMEKERMLHFLVDYLGKAGFSATLSVWIEDQYSQELIPNGFKRGWFTIDGNTNGKWKEIPVRKLDDEYLYRENQLVDL